MPSGILNRRRFTQLAALGLALPAAPARAEIRKVRLGVLRLASSGAVFIAQDSGYFQQAGLDVELVFFDAAQPIAVACASGDIDFGVTAFTAGLFNLAGKGALAVIAGQSREVPGFPLDAYLAPTTPAGAALTSPKDIRGRSVGITQIGSSFHYAAGLLAEKYGFPICGGKIRAAAIHVQHCCRIDRRRHPDGAVACNQRASRHSGWQCTSARLGRRSCAVATGRCFRLGQDAERCRDHRAVSRCLQTRLPRLSRQPCGSR